MSGLKSHVINIKKYISSTIKYIGEIDTFANTGPQKVPYMLNRSEYGHC